MLLLKEQMKDFYDETEHLSSVSLESFIDIKRTEGFPFFPLS